MLCCECVRQCVHARAHASLQRGDKVCWESSGGVGGGGGGEVGRRRAPACKPQTGWLRRGCTQAQSCLCQGNYPDAHPPLVEPPVGRVANALAPPFIAGGKLSSRECGSRSCLKYMKLPYTSSLVCRSASEELFAYVLARQGDFNRDSFTRTPHSAAALQVQVQSQPLRRCSSDPPR